MSATKFRLETKAKHGANKANGETERQAEQLLNEIDNLALLLHEVRKQTDRIEAAADAIGDAVLSHLPVTLHRATDSPNARKAVSIMQIKSSPQPRTLLPRLFDVRNA
ncbi:MAG TPA: hypothetical protein VMU05_09725 [Dongiaceae bacterium]|nr:hypothetical protein [Dongiaceae bacterium]